jgi:hypothetical protein
MEEHSKKASRITEFLILLFVVICTVLILIGIFTNLNQEAGFPFAFMNMVAS